MSIQKQTSGKYPPIKGIRTLVKEGEIAFVKINREIFEKTNAEHNALRKARKEHNGYIKICGCDPSKILNIG
jgi:hypothetical protein